LKFIFFSTNDKAARLTFFAKNAKISRLEQLTIIPGCTYDEAMLTFRLASDNDYSTLHRTSRGNEKGFAQRRMATHQGNENVTLAFGNSYSLKTPIFIRNPAVAINFCNHL
jgi:hypothetical protein